MTYPVGVLGGVFCMPSNVYSEVNGFSNRFKGWGYEDLDFETRVRAAGVAINRSKLVPRLGVRGDCYAEMGLADLSAPAAEGQKNLAQNGNTQELATNTAAYAKNWRAAVKGDGLSALHPTTDFVLLGVTENPTNIFRMRVATVRTT